MYDSLCARLSAQNIPYQRNAPMAALTTLKVGGPADLLIDAQGAADAAFVLQNAKDHPVLVVGNGSNLLVRDGGIRGIVLRIAEGMSGHRQEGNLLHLQAGVSLAKAARLAQRAGLSGMEALSGIPGTVGGAVYMNAGAYGTEMRDVVTRVDALRQTGEPCSLPLEALAFGYRKSALMSNHLLATQVTLSLSEDNPEAIAARMADFAKRRREKQPLTWPSAGSFFKRPEGGYASALIDQAGLKGASVGGAEVSTLHAGFLINKGNATANDFLELCEHVISRVQQTSGITLEPEVHIIGCDSSC